MSGACLSKTWCKGFLSPTGWKIYHVIWGLISVCCTNSAEQVTPNVLLKDRGLFKWVWVIVMLTLAQTISYIVHTGKTFNLSRHELYVSYYYWVRGKQVFFSYFSSGGNLSNYALPRALLWWVHMHPFYKYIFHILFWTFPLVLWFNSFSLLLFPKATVAQRSIIEPLGAFLELISTTCPNTTSLI